jgi:hypothetical protein
MIPFWIKFAAQTCTLLLYSWALLAPLVLRTVLGHGELQRLVDEDNMPTTINRRPHPQDD